MTFNRLSMFALAAAFAVATAPLVVVPTAAVAANQECGFTHENGKLVFLGTCAGESSGDSSEQPAGAPPSGCGDSKTVVGYRLLVTGC